MRDRVYVCRDKWDKLQKDVHNARGVLERPWHVSSYEMEAWGIRVDKLLTTLHALKQETIDVIRDS